MSVETRHLTPVQQAAADYIARGWRVIPLARGDKNPEKTGWLKIVFKADDFRPTDNIGLRSVNGLVDVDCDAPEVVDLASAFLPPTGAIFGRKSKPRSHWLYTSTFEKPVTYKDVGATDEKKTTDRKATLVEIRVNHQTMAPPSTHPSGEVVMWGEGRAPGEPATQSQADLTRAVQLLATAALIVRYYNPKDNRHDWGLALAGFLFRLDVTEVEATKVFTEAARVVGDTEVKDRLDAVRSTYAHDVDEPLRARTALQDETQKNGAAFIKSRERIWGVKAISATLKDFYAYLPQHEYLFVPTRELWPSASVNARIPPIALGVDDQGKPKFLKPNVWLDSHQAVQQMIWAPGQPLVIQDKLAADGGWFEQPGCACINLYRSPLVSTGNAGDVAPWLDHIAAVYPGEGGTRIIRVLAHRVQRPFEKVNHALVLGGPQGIGKDSILEPVKVAIGPWNFQEVAPSDFFEPYNPWLKAVILRVSEARDLGDVNRYAFYERMKTYTAAPPDVLRMNDKYIRSCAVFNVCCVIYTTNHLADGMYLPADDRRHDVQWSPLAEGAFPPSYFTSLYAWYANGGAANVAAYLATYDLSTFDPKAPPPKTDAFWMVVDANRAPEDAELADLLDRMGKPAAVTPRQILDKAQDAVGTAGYSSKVIQLFQEPKFARQIPHRMAEVGYEPHRNNGAKDGLWVIGGRRQPVYVKRELIVKARSVAVAELLEAKETVKAKPMDTFVASQYRKPTQDWTAEIEDDESTPGASKGRPQ